MIGMMQGHFSLLELPKDNKIGAIIEIVDALPVENRMLLKTVCQFLTEVHWFSFLQIALVVVVFGHFRQFPPTNHFK